MNTTHRYRSRFTALLAMAVVGVLLSATPAFADTSQASATAINLQLFGMPLVSTGTFTASNDGTTQTTSGNATPNLSILGTQSVVSAGVLSQRAVADSNGTSAACAGLVSPGGVLQIGTTGACTPANLVPGGVSLLGGLITADAIYAQCTASSNGTATATANLVGLKVFGLPLVITGPTMTIPGIGTLAFGQPQTIGVGGTVTETALHIDVLPLLNGGASLDIGKVTCGPNAATGAVSAFPTKGLPIAGGIVAAVGGVLFIRRRKASASAAAV
jgi:hypothetical protein